MQIIIEIPEEYYQYVKLLFEATGKTEEVSLPYKAIAKGTPLPKGHGNLIERNKVLTAMHTMFAHNALKDICKIPVIVEADKEE